MAAARRQNKQLLWDLWRAQNADQDQAVEGLRAHYAESIQTFGFYPIKRLGGLEQALDVLWRPLYRAFPDLERRPAILLANSFQGRDWVASAGDFLGTFREDWLGIPADGQRVSFRYGEFCQMEAGRVAELRLLIDLPQLIRQVDTSILPPNYGRDIDVPGPRAGDGLELGDRDAGDSAVTLALVEDMIFGGLNRYDQVSQDSQGLERFFSGDLVWHGPVGIGTTVGLDEFKRHAQGPIVAAFPDRKGVGHQARIAEGLYAASTGWPSLVGTHRGEFLGWPPTGKKVGWDIMDFWRRDGGRLRENWVLIDLPQAALQSGVALYPALANHAHLQAAPP